MMTFDQVLGAYESFVRTREVPDEVELTERKETDSDDRGSEAEVS